MAKKPTRPAKSSTTAGRGGETHQVAKSREGVLTTNQGTAISDNQNSLRAGVRGPTMLEDFIFREKITHFDHERIPERIVHARGSGAHGYFEPYKSWSKLTRAAFLQDPKARTPVFVRFSTVAGGAGSGDTPRDVRGFAVKFYTGEGNFDLVGNNIPVFFIQDAIKFPDLDSLGEDGARPWVSAGGERARHVLGLHLADARKPAHDYLGDVRPDTAEIAADDGGLRRSHVSLRQRRRRVDLREVSLAAEDRLRHAHLGRVGQALRRRPRLPAPRPARRDRRGRLSGVRVLRPGVRR